MNEVATVEEYANHQRCSSKLIYSLIYKGELPAYKLGREWRIPVVDADEVLIKSGQERAKAIQERSKRRRANPDFDFLKALDNLKKEVDKKCDASFHCA